MGPLAQKLRNTKVDIAVSLLRLHTIRRAEFLSVFLIFKLHCLCTLRPNASEALCATEARGVDSTHQWKRKSRSCIFCVPATEANLLEVIEKWRGPRLSFAKIQNAFEMISMRRDL